MLGFHVPGPVGFYNAYSQPTRLYAQHRGVETIDFALYRASLADLVTRLTQEDRYLPAQNYEPSTGNLLKEWRIKSDAPQNVSRNEPLDLRDGQGEDLRPGIYFLEATAPGFERDAWQNRHFLNVATAVLTVKQATDRLTVWAVNVGSGAPIAGEPIEVYGPGGMTSGQWPHRRARHRANRHF